MAITPKNMCLYKYKGKQRGAFMYGFWGYNSSLTNTIAGISAGLSIANGVLDGFKAKNDGASTGDAIAAGINTAGYGVANALFGSVIDRNTGSYAGSFMNTASMGNPSQATESLFGAALMSSFMRPMFGYPMMYASPMMFSSASFLRAPMMMGNCCCWCC